MIEFNVYAGLFLIALAAATILPLQSEAAMVALLMADYPPVPIILVASVGNILGAVANWWLGRGIDRFSNRRWFPVDAKALERARQWYGRFGKWSLLLSWVPVVGDPLTVIAGVLREPLFPFVLLVTAAKLGRYLVLAAVVLR